MGEQMDKKRIEMLKEADKNKGNGYQVVLKLFRRSACGSATGNAIFGEDL